jgi:beta-glucanase (GH16 family)
MTRARILAVFGVLLGVAVFAGAGDGARTTGATTRPSTRPSTVAEMEAKGWVLTFSDEFEGEKLDSSKWTDQYWNGRYHGNNELQYYAPDGYEVKDGRLRLLGQRREAGGRQYTSGMIQSLGHFEQRYGWFEIRAKFPKGKGYWPAFWLLPASKRWPPEIDVLEILGHDPKTVYFTTHWRGGEAKDAPGARPRHLHDEHHWTGPDFSADFHTFAVEWEKGSIVWYVDGVERARTDKGVPDEAMYVIANLAIGGDWPGKPDRETVFPGVMEVDWVRVYRRK